MSNGYLRMHCCFTGSRLRSNPTRYVVLLLHAMSQNLSASSLTGWIGLNGDDLLPSVLSKALIEDRSSNPMAMPNFFLFILSFFDGVEYSWMF